jgi:beta-aspartyl-peptidase (threonine type)
LKRALIILVHGGAGRGAMTSRQRTCLRDVLSFGYDRLVQGHGALDAVEGTIRCLEASGMFNAGTGSRLQLDGVRRMDAALMEGEGLAAGAVAGIEDVMHPITAARCVMERTPHVLLAGPGATQLARHFKLQRQPAPTPEQRVAVRREAEKAAPQPGNRSLLALFTAMTRPERIGKHYGTVGAVALDVHGTVAAGASTGGIALMLPGRVGDTPLVGCGVYADNAGGAVSMTGIGEGIIRLAVAKAIVDRLSAGLSPATATRRVLDMLVRRIAGAAGALVLSPDGRFAIRHTTPHMSAGYWHGRGKPVVANRWR